jgi:polyisoprenoid-binding protein YceI
MRVASASAVVVTLASCSNGRRQMHKSIAALIVSLAVAGALHVNPSAQTGGNAPAQGQPVAPERAARAPLAIFDTSKPAKLDIMEATGRYRVQEQLAGLSILSEAVGTTQGVTGTLVLGPEGSFAPQSKIMVDLKSLKSDQELRDSNLNRVVLETWKFPTLTFVPKRTQGLQLPLPSTARTQVIGFQMIGDMTLHGVTKEAIWTVVATLSGATVAGQANTTFLFSDYNLMKPSVSYVLTTDDKIKLEVEFKCVRSVL